MAGRKSLDGQAGASPEIRLRLPGSLRERIETASAELAKEEGRYYTTSETIRKLITMSLDRMRNTPPKLRGPANAGARLVAAKKHLSELKELRALASELNRLERLKAKEK